MVVVPECRFCKMVVVPVSVGFVRLWSSLSVVCVRWWLSLSVGFVRLWSSLSVGCVRWWSSLSVGCIRWWSSLSVGCMRWWSSPECRLCKMVVAPECRLYLITTSRTLVVIITIKNDSFEKRPLCGRSLQTPNQTRFVFSCLVGAQFVRQRQRVCPPDAIRT